jgi:large subunit ribosomal protein L21
MYAIVRDRGMQYRVEQGQTLQIDRLEQEPGTEIEFDEVLLVRNDETVQVGTPLVTGAKVRARVMGMFKGKKIIVFRYRRKKRYRRRTGHRQQYTRVQIQEILVS